MPWSNFMCQSNADWVGWHHSDSKAKMGRWEKSSLWACISQQDLSERAEWIQDRTSQAETYHAAWNFSIPGKLPHSQLHRGKNLTSLLHFILPDKSDLNIIICFWTPTDRAWNDTISLGIQCLSKPEPKQDPIVPNYVKRASEPLEQNNIPRKLSEKHKTARKKTASHSPCQASVAITLMSPTKMHILC